MDKKNERITGLVIGLIGLVVFFNDIIYYLNDDRMGSRQRQTADYLFYFIQLISILFVWFYRACIGHWALKSVRVFYKKL